MIFCGGILSAVFYRITAARNEILAAFFHCAAIRFSRTTAARYIDAARGGIPATCRTASACLISLYRLADLLRGDFRIDQRALRIAIKKI